MTLFEEYMQAAKGLVVISTAVDGQPSSRLMGFAPDPQQPNVWYLVSQPDATKVKELAQNERVAILTLLNENGARIESNQATMTRSDKQWSEVASYFKAPIFSKMHPHPEEEVLYQLTIHSARLASYAGNENVTFD
ncbi:pyridoxamine 5'-phosphate oxidase family protein [Convivina intestini]|uniref:Pyridoxamine 5'-phosphate oxidase n=1 Tax=Convivina intestini TaxID=1505726 RepID=A0A2U1D6Y4_9LACO|nr:pyridoxamine 5'-phosphate oxidase family protein [Convivina intestini]PVY83446.1 pyridoxamine 5'-phosphate oxidase [Convivina intestini]CAH1855857.1 hypothetical protein R077811_01133 [Convivina intestini]SDC03311.1 Pyridoxamine 5'-phosphate oxidase [Leuconostocaceae bacterium R-53105]